MSNVSLSRVGGIRDLVLYTYRTNRENIPITTTFALRTGLTMFADGEQVGLRTYPTVAALTVFGVVIRALGLVLVLPALLVTGWMTVASLPLVILFAVLLIEAKAGGTLTIQGVSIRFQKGGLNAIIYTLLAALSFVISAATLLNIALFQQGLNAVVAQLSIIAVGLVVAVVGRSFISLVRSSADRRPAPAVTPLHYTEMKTEDVNKAIVAFNQSLPNGVSRIPTVDEEARGSALQHAVLGKGIDEAFRARVSSIEQVGPEAKDLDAVLSTVLSYHYDSPLAEADRRAGITEE